MVFFFGAKYESDKEIAVIFDQTSSRLLPLNNSTYFVPSFKGRLIGGPKLYRYSKLQRDTGFFSPLCQLRRMKSKEKLFLAFLGV